MLFLLIYLATAHPADAAEILDLDPKVCAAIIAHEPADDVEYKGGVDVHGKPVVEADITPMPVRKPETLTFDITVDAAKSLGLNVPAGVEGQAKIGTVKIDPKGRMTFDGKPLEGDAQAALRDICKPKETIQKPQKIIYNR